jgi:hypothetical protein
MYWGIGSSGCWYNHFQRHADSEAFYMYKSRFQESDVSHLSQKCQRQIFNINIVAVLLDSGSTTGYVGVTQFPNIRWLIAAAHAGPVSNSGGYKYSCILRHLRRELVYSPKAGLFAIKSSKTMRCYILAAIILLITSLFTAATPVPEIKVDVGVTQKRNGSVHEPRGKRYDPYLIISIDSAFS